MRKAVLGKGQQFEYIIDAATESEMDLMGEIQKSFTNSHKVTLITVERVLDTTYLLNSRVTRKTDKAPLQGRDFDSGNPPATADSPEWKRFIKGVGDIAMIVIDKKGQTISRGDTTEDPDDGGLSANLSIGADSGKKIYELFASLPLKATKVGDTWTDSSFSDGMKQVAHYTLTSLTATEAVTVFNGTLLAETEMDNEGEKMQMRLEGTFTGTAGFDVGTGVIKTSEDTYKCVGKLTMRGISVPVTMKATHMVKVNRVNH